MEWIRKYPIGAAFIGLALLLVIGAVLSSIGSDRPTGDGITTLPTDSVVSTEAPESTTAHPEVPPVNCGSLVTLEEVDDALGVTDQLADMLQFAGGEACTDALADNETFFVRIEPGNPNDFEPDAHFIGVSGEPVSGVGDDAIWFGGVEAEGGGDVGALSVRQVTPLGALHYRIVLGRPDLDSAAQLEIAKTVALAALPRFPGVEVEQPEPEVVTFDREEVDRSNVSFVDNLLAKEEAGEWTRGEGLVATLKLFSGELDAVSVLRHDELLSYEGTGIFAMANQYLTNGPDAAARAEVARLLDLLVFSNEQLDRMAGIGEVTVMAGMGPVALGTTAAAEEDCAKFFSGWVIPPGIGKCLEKMTSSFCLDIGECAVFAPAPSLPQAGWQDMHYGYAVAAMEDGVRKFDEMGDMPPVSIVFAVGQHPIAGAVAAPRFGPEINEPKRPCGIALYPTLQGLKEADFKQFVAHELAHCFQGENFRDQVQPDPDVTAWREEGLAEYLSNVVYTDTDLESREFLGPFADGELATTVVNRAYENFIFFQFLYWEIGNEGIFNLVGKLPDSGGKSDQMDKLAADPGAELYHEFVKDVTDQSVRDTGTGPMHDYEVRADEFPISGPIILVDDPQQFGVVRLHLVVDPGQYACVEYHESGALRSSWRPGEPGAPGGSWSASLPDPLEGEAVFVVTATEEGATFTVEVTDVSDDPECEEEEEEEEEECDFDLICDPSGFYFVVPSN